MLYLPGDTCKWCQWMLTRSMKKLYMSGLIFFNFVFFILIHSFLNLKRSVDQPEITAHTKAESVWAKTRVQQTFINLIGLIGIFEMGKKRKKINSFLIILNPLEHFLLTGVVSLVKCLQPNILCIQKTLTTQDQNYRPGQKICGKITKNCKMYWWGTNSLFWHHIPEKLITL